MRGRGKIFLTLGVFLGVAILAPCAWHWRLRAVNESYIAGLAARGEPMTLAGVRPPPVPAAENSADIFLRAAALLAADSSVLSTNSVRAMISVGPGKALAAAPLPAAAGWETTNSWADVSAAFAQNQAALNLLEQIPEHPALDFHIHYERGMGSDFDFTNLHVVELKKAAWFLCGAVTIALHEGDVAGALRSQRALLALVNAMQNERFLITEWVRMAMLGIARDSTWEILQTPGVTEPQLAALQEDWERVDFIQGWQRALALERVTGEITLKQWRGSATRFGRYLERGEAARGTSRRDTLPAKARRAFSIFAWRFWWSYPDELRALRGYEALLAASRFAATNENFLAARSSQQAALAALQTTSLPNEFAGMLAPAEPDFHSLLSQSIATQAETTEKVMTAETGRQLTIAAIALQRFKLAQGHYPGRFSALVPEFLAALPPDPADGRTLRYRPLADGTFLLYSIGENGVDDNGNTAPDVHGPARPSFWQSEQPLDYVWPQAVAADDVQFIYAPAPAAK